MYQNKKKSSYFFLTNFYIVLVLLSNNSYIPDVNASLNVATTDSKRYFICGEMSKRVDSLWCFPLFFLGRPAQLLLQNTVPPRILEIRQWSYNLLPLVNVNNLTRFPSVRSWAKRASNYFILLYKTSDMGGGFWDSSAWKFIRKLFKIVHFLTVSNNGLQILFFQEHYKSHTAEYFMSFKIM